MDCIVRPGTMPSWYYWPLSVLLFVLLFVSLFVLLPADRLPGQQNQGPALARRFFPPAPIATPTPIIPPLEIAPVDIEEVPVAQHNEGVRLNNKGVAALESGDLAQAVELFQKAVDQNPWNVGFLSNLLGALAKEGKQVTRAAEVCNRIVGLDPHNSKAFMVMGSLYLTRKKQPLQAIPYLNAVFYARNEDPETGLMLANAWHQAGYPDAALPLLERFVSHATDDPFPHYLLGNLWLARQDYVPALRALNNGLPLDQEGYVHDACLRARFFAGQLAGLGEAIRQALRRFPNIMNRDTLERILFSLEPHTFRLQETVNVALSNPQAVQSLDFLIRLPPQVPGHQRVILEQCELVWAGKKQSVRPEAPDNDGKVRVRGIPEMIQSKFALRMVFEIQVESLLGVAGQFPQAKLPDLNILKADPDMSLDHPLLALLEKTIDSTGGNYLQEAYLAIGRGLHYAENFEDYSVAWAFENPDKCDCTEFSRVLAALCLRRGLPARVATGFLVKPEFIGQEINIGHAWCEVHFDKKGWVPVDPTLGSTMQWAYFGNLLSDQILFDRLQPGQRGRVSVDFTSSHTDLDLQLSNSYLITLVR